MKAGLELEGFPLDRLGQGSFVNGQAGEIASAIRRDACPKIHPGHGCGGLLGDVIDQLGKPCRSMGCRVILKGGSKVTDGPISPTFPSGAECDHV